MANSAATKALRPERSGSATQEKEQKNHSQGMAEDVSEVMATAVEPESLAIEHVRQHGDRVPVIGVSMGKDCEDAAHSSHPP